MCLGMTGGKMRVYDIVGGRCVNGPLKGGTPHISMSEAGVSLDDRYQYEGVSSSSCVMDHVSCI